MSVYHEVDFIEMEIRSKQEKAERYFEQKYTKAKDKRKYKPVLTEVLSQIRICEELCCSLNETVIKDWIDSESIMYVNRCARKIKLA
jgi:hypothetical protein